MKMRHLSRRTLGRLRPPGWVRAGWILGVCWMAACVSHAQEAPSLDEKLDAIFRKADAAIDQGDKAAADFWMARYMGLTTFNKETQRYYTDLFPLYEKRKDLAGMSSFISGKYTEEFLDFFITATHFMWGIPDQGVNEDLREFSVRGVSNSQYFAQLIISPKLETWTMVGRDFGAAVVPVVSSERPPRLVAGKQDEGVPYKYFDEFSISSGGNYLHYIWPLEFHDLDGDKIPEIWMRYNETLGDGFEQVLDIYKIENEQRVSLMKKFVGAAEGIARRTDDGRVEVAQGASDTQETHMNYNIHRFETFEYKDGDFVKISETTAAHILRDESWKRYYFNVKEGE